MRIILVIATVLVLCVPCDAGIVHFNRPRFEEITQSSALIDDLKDMGCTFYADYTDASLTADYSKGLGTATFTASRGSSNPATYIDSDGIVHTIITSNVGRFTRAYYDATGVHPREGLLIEPAITNTLTKSEEFEHGNWTKTNITADDTDAGSTAPDGASQTSSITASDANGTLVMSVADAVAGVYTASVWVKRKTGSGTINLRANQGDAYTAITVTNQWTRHQVQSSSLANPDFDLQIVTNTDAIYIYGAQLEKLPYATSFIPTTTAALTRNAEAILKYETARNRTVAQEAFAVVLTPELTDTDKGSTSNPIFSTDTKDRTFQSGWGEDIGFTPNNTDSSGCDAFLANKQVFTTNVEVLVSGNCQHTSPYAICYVDGVPAAGGDVSDNFIDNTWGSYFWVGMNVFQTGQFPAIIKCIAFFDRPLTSSEHERLKLIL